MSDDERLEEIMAREREAFMRRLEHVHAVATRWLDSVLLGTPDLAAAAELGPAIVGFEIIDGDADYGAATPSSSSSTHVFTCKSEAIS